MTNPTRLESIRHSLRSKARLPEFRAEEELEWYATRGASLFERSSLGGQLDAARLASAALVDCPVCCSTYRKITAHGAEKRGHLLGDGNLFLGLTRGILSDGSWCEWCAGSGFIEVEIEKNPNKEVTARPTCAEIRDHGYEVDGVEMQRFAQVTRWLQRTPQPWREVLHAYYGPDATRCVERQPWGVLLAVFPFCASHVELFERCKPRAGEPLHPILRACQAARDQEQSPADWRRKLLEACKDEAEGLLRDSLEAFGREMGRDA